MKLEMYVEVNGNKILHKDLVEKVKDVWKKEDNFIKDILSMSLYYKPEESMCYFVINGKHTGKISVT